MSGKSLIVSKSDPGLPAVAGSNALDHLLATIRPEWKAKSLIERVKALLPVDPSSACQRLLNAAIHDLREKIIIAGLDVADEAATAAKLPSAKKAEDVYEYSTTHTLDLAYRMGLINRPEWRKLKRAYDIRKDLEHEDDLYEAGMEDCVYVFTTCIEIVLARDPIAPIRVSDFKEVIEAPSRVTLSSELVDDFASAPDKRQVEIFKFLIGISRDGKQPDITRQNAVEALRTLRPHSRRGAQAEVGQSVQEKLGRSNLDLADMKVAAAAGITPYLKQAKVRQFFEDYVATLKKVGYSWKQHDQHGKVLDDLEDVGGLESCPAAVRADLVLWLVLLYIGEPGGYGQGINRSVFYSNSGAPKAQRMIASAGKEVAAEIEAAAKNKTVKLMANDKHVGRRLEELRDLVS